MYYDPHKNNYETDIIRDADCDFAENIVYYDLRDIILGNIDEYTHPGTFTVEQCTGLRDKNGNLIYEGDILNAMCFEPDCEWHGCQVKVIWDKTAFQFLIFGERPYQILPFDQVMYNAENDGFELIGNIHEQAK